MKTDARVRYTKMVIRNALLQLLQIKPIQQVRVKELCDIAEINRATFYSHYSDIYDLLDKMQESLYIEIETTLQEKDATNFSEIIEQVLEVISNHANLCQILFSENGDKGFFRKLQEVGLKPSITIWKTKYPESRLEDLELMYLYIFSGSIRLIEHWVNNGLQESKSTMALTINEINRYALMSLDNEHK